MRKALLASTAALGYFAILALSSNAQEAKKDDNKPVARPSIEVSGYTRPGSPDDAFNTEGALIRRLGFEADSFKKFKIMGGTVYFAVFKNTGLVEGDTFGTGMANFDAKFEAGRSFKDSVSPRYDRKAKYLYLYQVVNDRTLDPKVLQVKADKAGGEVKVLPFDDKPNPNAAPPKTEDIASFALKLIADPRYITSWGHFRESGFAANVTDVDGSGKIVKNVVDDGKGNKTEKEKIIQLSFSSLPAIVTKITHPEYGRRARSHSLGELEAGFGVETSGINMTSSKGYGDIKLIADQGDKDKTVWASFAQNILKATDSGREPEYVQLMYLSNEERAALTTNPIIPGSAPDVLDDEITRAIFRVDFRKGQLLKQGSRSVVFGFTTDLPPVNAPIRIDTPKAAAVSEGLRLANYFSDEGIARAPGVAAGGVVNVAGAEGAALALAVGTALGIAASPAPAAPEAAGGFAGITGGFGGGLGGTTGSGGGGGFSTPGLGGGFSRGGGGGFGGGQGAGQGSTGQTQAGSQTGTQAGSQTINFNATLINQQDQAQQQGQFQGQFQDQNQNQNQNQHQNNRGNHGHNNHHGHHGHHGHVVPAPASLLLGLLGLPGLLFLRRRKTTDMTPEATDAIA